MGNGDWASGIGDREEGEPRNGSSLGARCSHYLIFPIPNPQFPICATSEELSESSRL